ncbi:MAG: cation diffusion facilitator family transporter [Chitinophagales bacterium]
MNHDHEHENFDPINPDRAFVIGIILNAAFMIAEFIAGFLNNSLALISDAGHNFSDVAGLALSLFAYRIARSKSTQRFTYGLQRSTILAALVNAVILFIAAGSIGVEAVRRIFHPQPINGVVISIVAGAGIVINTASALLFQKGKDRDLNMKGAYVHLIADALVSAGVVIAGILIYFTGILWIDPLISLLIMGVVIYTTWSLMRESLWLSLDAVPANIDLDQIRHVALNTNGVKDIHHVHVWAMGTTRNAMTAHLVVNDSFNSDAAQKIKAELKHKLEELNVQHATFELETSDVNCETDEC